MAWVAGFEPANLGVKVLCLTRLAAPKCILKNQASKPLNSARTSEYVVAYSKFFIVWGSTTTCPRDLKSYTPKSISKECTATSHNPEPCIQTSIGCFPNMYGGDNGSRTHVHNAYSLQVFLRHSHCLIQFPQTQWQGCKEIGVNTHFWMEFSTIERITAFLILSHTYRKGISILWPQALPDIQGILFWVALLGYKC